MLFKERNRSENMPIIRKIVRRCLASYNLNRHKYPKRVVIYRNGCSEGNFGMVIFYFFKYKNFEIKK